MAKSRAGRRRLILVLAVLVCGAALGGAYALKQARLAANMDRWLAEATTAYGQGRYAEALEPFSRYVSRDRTDVEVLLSFADTRRRLPTPNGSHLTQARSIIQTALAIEPDSLRGCVMLMQVYTDGRLLTEAKLAAEQVREIDSTNIEAHQTLVWVARETNSVAEAQTAAMRMAEAIPDDIAVQLAAFDTLMAIGAVPEALEEFIAQREGRFAGRLGLELMRVSWMLTRLGRLPESDPGYAALQAEIESAINAAAAMPAGAAVEASKLVQFFDIFGQGNSPICRSAMDRFLADTAIAPDLVGFAAQRAWSQGDAAEAGRLVLAHAGDLADADEALLGWLALSGLPEADAAIERLGMRTSESAKDWLDLARTASAIERGDLAAATDAMPTLVDRNSALPLVLAYLRGGLAEANGELSRAAEVWEDLLRGAPFWHVARAALGRVYFALDRPLDARRELRLVARTTDPLLRLRVEVAIDEQGLDRPELDAPDSFETTTRVMGEWPDSTALLALAARAALATGRTTEAAALADRVLSADLSQDGHDVVQLVEALDRSDPQRADAIRAALGPVATDPLTIYTLATDDARAGKPAEGLARLEEGLATAQDADRLQWDCMLASYLDAIGDPGAPARLLELSAKYPDERNAQLVALLSRSAWVDPEPLGVVIERLRRAAGEQNPQWRVFRGRRTLALLDPADPTAAEQARGVMFDLVEITNDRPRDAVAAETFARAAEIAGDADRAADYLLRAVRADPGDFERRLRLINTLLPRAGRMDEARQFAADLTQLGLRTSTQVRARAQTLERFGLRAEAQEDWKLLADAGDPDAKIRSAMLLAETGSLDDADAMVEAVLASPELTDALRRNAAQYLARRGRLGEGLALLEQLEETGGPGGRDAAVAQYLMVNTDTLEQARDLESKARQQDSPVLWAATVQSYMNLRQFEDARRVFLLGREAHPDAAELGALARLFNAREAGDPLANLLEVRAVIGEAASPAAERIATLIDRRTSLQIDDARLVEALAALTEQDPGSAMAWNALALAQEAARDIPWMETTLRRALAALPADPNIANTATRLYAANGNPVQALAAAGQWRARVRQPDYGADHAYAALLAEQDRMPEALEVLRPWTQNITENREHYPDDAFLLAALLGRTGESPAAVDLMLPLTGGTGRQLDLCIRVASYLSDLATRQQWLEDLTTRVVEVGDPALGVSLATESWEWAVAGGLEPEQVLRVAERCESLLGKPAGGHFGVRQFAAMARAELGQYEAVVAHYRTMLEEQPDRPEVRNNLADALLHVEGGAEEALTLANTAVEMARAAALSPGILRSLLDTRAQALLATGRASEAAAVYREVRELAPGWVPGVLGLAESLHAAGESEAARGVLDELVRLDPSDEEDARATALRAKVDQ